LHPKYDAVRGYRLGYVFFLFFFVFFSQRSLITLDLFVAEITPLVMHFVPTVLSHSKTRKGVN